MKNAIRTLMAIMTGIVMMIGFKLALDPTNMLDIMGLSILFMMTLMIGAIVVIEIVVQEIS